MEYALAAIFALLVGTIVWAYFTGKKHGHVETERNAYKAVQKRREEGDAVMSEQIADEDAWIADQYERNRVQREGDS